MAEHFKACINEKDTKYTEYPFKLVDNSCTSENKNAAKHQGTENAPEKHFVLIFPLNTKEGEEHQENKKIIH